MSLLNQNVLTNKASRDCSRIKNNVLRSKNIINLKETHNRYDLSEEEQPKYYCQIRMY